MGSAEGVWGEGAGEDQPAVLVTRQVSAEARGSAVHRGHCPAAPQRRRVASRELPVQKSQRETEVAVRK